MSAALSKHDDSVMPSRSRSRGIAIAIVTTVLLLLGGCGYLVVQAVNDFENPFNTYAIHKHVLAEKRKGQEKADAVLAYLRDNFRGEPWSVYLGDAAEANWDPPFLASAVGVVSIITEISEIATKRTPEEDAYASQICDAAVTYPHETSGDVLQYTVAVLANDAHTQLTTCSSSSRAVAPSSSSSPVPTTAVPVVENEAGRALSTYLRENFADAPWLAEYDAAEQGAPEAIIRTTMTRWKLSRTETKLADAMCQAAATAPGVERAEIRRTNDSVIVYCAKSSTPSTTP